MSKLMRVRYFLIIALTIIQGLNAQTPLYKNSVYSLYSDKVIEGKFTATIESDKRIVSDYANFTGMNASEIARYEPVNKIWNLSKDISKYPTFSSGIAIADALYNKSLEEMIQNVRPDGTFMAGAKWDGVWTRDISYSILLTLAMMEPEIAKKSLRAKVQNKKIIQDTGTGGSWPISTDRTTWALAAWEIYLVTGDKNWLNESYEIIKNSAEDDLVNARDNNSGLFLGESSFLDWREQTYPKWMDPVDIYQSQNLGTNAVHYRTYVILDSMEKELGLPHEKYGKIAEEVKKGINAYLWMSTPGYYSQYLYGRNYLTRSERFEALGSALTVLFDIAGDKAERVISSAPRLPYGLPTIYPQIPNMFPYHNNSVWPFVESYFTWASAKVGNLKSVEAGIASIYRSTALFNTNKENFVVETGTYGGSALSSDRQLWSVAGNLALVYRVFYGMEFTPKGIVFNPMVPQSFAGEKSIKGFKYRECDLDINLHGWGDSVATVLFDGSPTKSAFVPSSWNGKRVLDITLTQKKKPRTQKINETFYKVSPEEPKLRYENGVLVWDKIPTSTGYIIYKNGLFNADSFNNQLGVVLSPGVNEYTVVTEWGVDNTSFTSEPFVIVAPEYEQIVYVDSTMGKVETDYPGFEAKGYIRLEDDTQPITFSFEVKEDGVYGFDFLYANGSGPINTDNKCCIRSLKVDDKPLGTIVMPQRGEENWKDYGFSNIKNIKLEKGVHTATLFFGSHNQNMNIGINRAFLNALRICMVYKPQK